jgi:hypothetical protein
MKCLDIACGESPHWLVKSLENPDGFYVGLDTHPIKYTPETFYWKSKEFMLDDAYRNNVPREKRGIPQFIDELAIASWLIDIQPDKRQDFLKKVGCSREPDYYEMNSRFEELRARPEGKGILTTKVSDLLYDDNKIIEVDHKKFPQIVGIPRDERSVFHSGSYAWNRIENEFFGKYPSMTMENLLRMPFPSEVGGKLHDALSRIHFVKGSMYDLPFKDKSFDYVRGSGQPSLQEEKAISEAQKVLKSGRIAKVWINGIDTEH